MGAAFAKNHRIGGAVTGAAVGGLGAHLENRYLVDKRMDKDLKKYQRAKTPEEKRKLRAQYREEEDRRRFWE